MSLLFSKISTARCLVRPHLTRAIRTKRVKKGVMIRLLEDIPEVGTKGMVMEVPRVMMRAWYYPAHLAEYVLRPKGGFQQSDLAVHLPPEPYLTAEPEAVAPVTDISPEPLLPSRLYIPRLQSLPNLVFRRRPISASSLAIFGSVTPANIFASLAEEHDMHLDPSQCTIKLEGNTLEHGRIKRLGTASCLITMTTGEEAWIGLDVIADNAPTADETLAANNAPPPTTTSV